MADEVIIFEPVTLGPPFGVWRPISSDIEVMALSMDALGTVRVRRRVPNGGLREVVDRDGS